MMKRIMFDKILVFVVFMKEEKKLKFKEGNEFVYVLEISGYRNLVFKGQVNGFNCFIFIGEFVIQIEKVVCLRLYNLIILKFFSNENFYLLLKQIVFQVKDFYMEDYKYYMEQFILKESIVEVQS